MAEKTETEAHRDQLSAEAAMNGFDANAAGNFAVLPEGFQVASLEGYQRAPNRITAKHQFIETGSLAEYLNRFATADTMVSADYGAASITAVIDGDAPEAPSFKAHTAAFQAKRHDTLAAWLAVSGKPMSQISFGRFLEDRATDVVQPDSASIMEMVMQFDATKKVTFKSSQRLHDGQRQFQYVEDNEARGAVTLPEQIVIRCPIYRGLDPQDVRFMLRYRIDDGSLMFTVEMHNKDEVMRAAFDRCIDAFRVDLADDRFIFVTG